MQPNEITLAVDELNSGSTTDHVYKRQDEFQNRTVYIRPAVHTLDARDQLGLYRTYPKPNGNFKGVAKTTAKFTVDVVVDGVDGVSQITAPAIVDVGFSLPQGIPAATVKILRQKVLALLDDDTIMDDLNLLCTV